MIGKAKSCSGGYSLFHYVMQDYKGYELLRNNLCGETPLEIFQEMKIIQNLNQRAEKKMISMVLSPSIKDGEILTKLQLKQITLDFLKDMNIDVENQQHIVFVHTEKKHRHIHILLNRVDENSRLIPDHFIGKKAQWSAHRVAEKWKLISAKQVRIDNMKGRNNEKLSDKNQKMKIKELHTKVIKTHTTSLEQYLVRIQNLDVKFIPSINKQGQLQGFRIKDVNTQKEYKASDIDKSLGLKQLLESGLPILNSNIALHSNLRKSQEIAKLKVKQLQAKQEQTRVKDERHIVEEIDKPRIKRR